MYVRPINPETWPHPGLPGSSCVGMTLFPNMVILSLRGNLGRNALSSFLSIKFVRVHKIISVPRLLMLTTVNIGLIALRLIAPLEVKILHIVAECCLSVWQVRELEDLMANTERLRALPRAEQRERTSTLQQQCVHLAHHHLCDIFKA